jgi:hypothetical protein
LREVGDGRPEFASVVIAAGRASVWLCPEAGGVALFEAV